MNTRSSDKEQSDSTSSGGDCYVVDTTGAGDSYIGGFLTATALGCSQETAMLLGTSVAAEKLQSLGSRKGLPTSEKLLNKLLNL